MDVGFETGAQATRTTTAVVVQSPAPAPRRRTTRYDSMDPNEARVKRRERRSFAITTPIAVAATAILWWMIIFSTDEVFLAVMGCAFAAVIVGVVAAIILANTSAAQMSRTVPGTTPVDAASTVHACIDALVLASRDGLRPADRPRLQTLLDETSRILETMGGIEPWVAVARLGGRAVPANLRMRGDELTIHGKALVDRVASPHGARLYGEDGLNDRMKKVVPVMAAIARDFGLDPRNLAEPTRQVPGLAAAAADERTPPALPPIAEPVRRLAAEWTAVDRPHGDDTPAALLADAAATNDLRLLEDAWHAARATAPADQVAAVDEDFGTAADKLAAAISEGLAERSRRDRDALTTAATFVRTKHVVWDDEATARKAGWIG